MMDWKALKKLDKDDLLELVGLEQRRGTVDVLMPTVTAFAVGVAVGVGIGMLLAPRPGHELRNQLRTRLQGEEGGQGLRGVPAEGTLGVG